MCDCIGGWFGGGGSHLRPARAASRGPPSPLEHEWARIEETLHEGGEPVRWQAAPKVRKQAAPGPWPGEGMQTAEASPERGAGSVASCPPSGCPKNRNLLISNPRPCSADRSEVSLQVVQLRQTWIRIDGVSLGVEVAAANVRNREGLDEGPGAFEGFSPVGG